MVFALTEQLVINILRRLHSAFGLDDEYNMKSMQLSAEREGSIHIVPCTVVVSSVTVQNV